MRRDSGRQRLCFHFPFVLKPRARLHELSTSSFFFSFRENASDDKKSNRRSHFIIRHSRPRYATVRLPNAAPLLFRSDSVGGDMRWFSGRRRCWVLADISNAVRLRRLGSVLLQSRRTRRLRLGLWIRRM